MSELFSRATHLFSSENQRNPSEHKQEVFEVLNCFWFF